MNYRDLNPQEFKKAFEATKNAVLLDVRTPREVADGKLAGAQTINFFDSDFSSKLSKMDPSKTYFVYCRSGNRSAQACMLLANQGFEKLVNLTGGYSAWQLQFMFA